MGTDSLIVYEVLIDLDETLRSKPESWGLFSTKQKAKTFISRLNLQHWQYSEIKKREVR